MYFQLNLTSAEGSKMLPEKESGDDYTISASGDKEKKVKKPLNPHIIETQSVGFSKGRYKIRN